MDKVKFKINRNDPDVAGSQRIDTFEFETCKGMSVLEALFHIVENLDGSLAFRYSCRGAVCGSCAMHINGKNRLACQTLIENLHSKTISISPLSWPRLTRGPGLSFRELTYSPKPGSFSLE